MKSKDKKTLGKELIAKRFLSLVICLNVILYSYIFYRFFFTINKSYAKEVNGTNEEIKISNAEKIDVNKIIQENTKQNQIEEFYTEEQVLEYITKYQTNAELPKGTIQVIQEGRQGKQEITKTRIYENGELILEEQVGAKVTKAAINKIVEIGEGKGKA